MLNVHVGPFYYIPTHHIQDSLIRLWSDLSDAGRLSQDNAGTGRSFTLELMRRLDVLQPAAKRAARRCLHVTLVTALGPAAPETALLFGRWGLIQSEDGEVFTNGGYFPVIHR